MVTIKISTLTSKNYKIKKKGYLTLIISDVNLFIQVLLE